MNDLIFIRSEIKKWSILINDWVINQDVNKWLNLTFENIYLGLDHNYSIMMYALELNIRVIVILNHFHENVPKILPKKSY